MDERTPVLVVEGVSCARPDLPSENIFEGASFTVYEGDVVALRARSGVGYVRIHFTSAVRLCGWGLSMMDAEEESSVKEDDVVEVSGASEYVRGVD